MSRFQSASGKSNVGARWLNPAALTRISPFRSVWTEACSTLANDPRSATSQLTRSDRRPRDSISSAITFTSSRRRELGTTSAPASASPRARVRPIPELPPITTATLPLRSSFLYPMVVQKRIPFSDPDCQWKMVPSSFRFPKAVYPLVGVGLQAEKIPARATEQHHGIYDLHLVSSTASSVSNAADSNRSRAGRLRVTHQQQDQNHAEEGNQPRDDHNRVERMGARGLAGVGKMAVEPPRPEGRGFLDYAQRYSAHVSI